MRRFAFFSIIVFTLASSSAFAASLDGRFGLTGKAGAQLPLQNAFISSTSETGAGIAAGGGLIYGFGNFAVEVDLTHAPQLDVEISGKKAYEATLNDIAIGMQYRLGSDRLVPFFGAGADFIKGNLKQSLTGAKYNLDWTEGGHVSGGIDYFLADGIAVTAEGRLLFAFDGDVKSGGVKVGKYDPMSFIGTVGIRLILPKSAFR